MTLERWTDGTGTELVRLVECPPCETPICLHDGRHRGHNTDAVSRLQSYKAIFKMMNVDPEDLFESSRDTACGERDTAKTV